MKKVIVNESLCIGCGACEAIDPEHFKLNEEGLSSIIDKDVKEDEKVTEAVESCPTGAISVEESAE